MIYLDYSAGTPADPAVLERFCQAEQRWPGNPNSAHAAGRAARDELARVTQSINSPAGAVPHILNVSVQGVKGTAFQRALDAEGVCVSVRSACASDGAPSQAVLAVSGDARNALAAWRISLSHCTTLEELEQFLAAFDRCRARLAQS